MVNSIDAIWDRLVDLVSGIDSLGMRKVGKLIEYSNETDLVKDLGLVGDDAFEFMESYAANLNVRTGDYESSNYFDAEGLSLLPSFKAKRPKLRITLGMLAMAARSGEWNTEALNQAVLENRYD